MNKQDYIKARKIIRGNGRYGLNFLHSKLRQEFSDYLFNVVDRNDRLAERYSIVVWCNRRGLVYNFRQIR